MRSPVADVTIAESSQGDGMRLSQAMVATTSDAIEHRGDRSDAEELEHLRDRARAVGGGRLGEGDAGQRIDAPRTGRLLVTISAASA